MYRKSTIIQSGQLFLMAVFLLGSLLSPMFNQTQQVKAATYAGAKNFMVWTSSHEDNDKLCSATITWSKPDLAAVKQVAGQDATLDKVSYVVSYTPPKGAIKEQRIFGANDWWWKPSEPGCDITYIFQIETYYGGQGGTYLGKSAVSYALQRADGYNVTTSGKCFPTSLTGRLERNISDGRVAHNPWLKWKGNTAEGCSDQTSYEVIPGKKIVYSPQVDSGKLADITSATTYSVTAFDSMANKIGTSTITINPSQSGTYAKGVEGGGIPVNPTPSTPNLTGAVENKNDVKLNWNDVKSSCKDVNRVSYEVWKDNARKLAVDTLTYTDKLSGDEANTKHTYYIKAFCIFGTASDAPRTVSGNSNQIEYTPPTTPGGTGTTKDIGGATDAPGGADPDNPDGDPKNKECKSMCNQNKWGWLKPTDEIADLICNIQCVIMDWMGAIITAMVDGLLVPSIL